MTKAKDDLVAEICRLRDVYASDPSQLAVLANLLRIAGCDAENTKPVDETGPARKSPDAKLRTED